MKISTVDGKRLTVEQLNTGSVDEPETGTGAGGFVYRLLLTLRRFNKQLSLFLAGMYTGLGCAGTPHGQHDYKDADAAKRAKGKAQRPKADKYAAMFAREDPPN